VAEFQFGLEEVALEPVDCVLADLVVEQRFGGGAGDAAAVDDDPLVLFFEDWATVASVRERQLIQDATERNWLPIELTDALASYVRRINLNPDDAPLQVGSGKELDEATARHVLNEKVGGYPISGTAGSFPVTLGQAFTALGLKIPSTATVQGLDADPHRQVEECLFLAGMRG
jgi:hypothetical protein